jgi:hypothetical protein
VGFFNFGASVIGFYKTGDYSVERRIGQGTTDDAGHYTKPGVTTVTIAASIQPAGGSSNLQDEKQGRYNTDKITIYTTGTLYTVDAVADQADVVTYNGDRYRVVGVEEFRVISNHNRYTAEKVTTP